MFCKNNAKSRSCQISVIKNDRKVTVNMPQPHPDAAVEAGAALLAMLPKLRMYNHFKQIATSDEEKTHRNTLYYRKMPSG